LRGWKHPSGGGRADGGLVRRPGGPGGDARPRFDAQISPGGYGWWYVDAISDDGRHGLTIIAFIGSVFSAYYKRSGRGDPLDHAALNVALYGPRARWSMTERGRGALVRDADCLRIGPSALQWSGGGLEIAIEERDKRLGIPWQRRVAGRIRLIPEAVNACSFALDPNGRHQWHCIAPRAHIAVEFKQPALSWSGSAYFDSNFGSESLEEGFRIWHWSRAHTSRGAAVCYEGIRRDGSSFASTLNFDASGRPQPGEQPMVAPLPTTKWLMERKTRADRGHASLIRTWEDAPFYARSTVSSRLMGEPVVAVQESLDLDRFASPIVQFMLPYRMPRSV
jgi:carotenoid 1,2-hydratase